MTSLPIIRRVVPHAHVVHGVCPGCGRSTHGDRRASPLGALCYSDTGTRVVACVCGSRARPVEAM